MGFKSFSILLFCLVSWSGALAVRRAVLTQQTNTVEGEAPFLMESALQFRMTEMVNETGTLPVRDASVQVPEGVIMRETYSVGAEWVYSFLAKLLPESWTFASRVRWISTGLFCLAIPFAGLWAKTLSGSMWSAWITAGILAASPAFAVRSSGLELSRENLAIPLFTLFLWLESSVRASDSEKWKWGASIGCALSLALAQCFWDLTQMVIGLWIVWSWIRVIREPITAKDDRIPLGCVAVSLVTAGLVNPYLRSHGFMTSPVMAMVLARALGSMGGGFLAKRRVQVGLLVSFLGVFWILGQLFAEQYSHFGELLFAKLHYLNQKPMDPSLLSYSQRIMWTPALNSTTWELTKAYFLFTLCIFSVTLLKLVSGKRWAGQVMGSVLFSSLFLLPVTILFFRFHVFWVLFASVVIGSGLLLHFSKLTRFRYHLLGGLLAVCLTGGELYLLLFFEPSTSSEPSQDQAQLMQLVKAMGGELKQQKGNRWGRPGASYGALENLSQQLRDLPRPGPVVANFGISASILAETGFPIVLHPKFETPGIRNRVRRFYEMLFLKTEEDFREWALGFGAQYYVHSNGNLSDLDIRNSPRYMVNAVHPPDHAPVYVFEERPQDATYFRPIGGNERYKIFQIISHEDEEFATSLTTLAQQALQRGDVQTAERRARQALTYHWKYQPAQDVLATILSL